MSSLAKGRPSKRWACPFLKDLIPCKCLPSWDVSKSHHNLKHIPFVDLVIIMGVDRNWTAVWEFSECYMNGETESGQHHPCPWSMEVTNAPVLGVWVDSSVELGCPSRQGNTTEDQSHVDLRGRPRSREACFRKTAPEATMEEGTREGRKRHRTCQPVSASVNISSDFSWKIWIFTWYLTFMYWQLILFLKYSNSQTKHFW